MRCILTANFSPWSRYSGGGQRSTHNLARALARRGHAVSVVFTKPPWERIEPPERLPYELLWAALPALRSASGAWLRPTSGLFVARVVEQRLRGAADAVVHGNGEEAWAVPSIRRAGTRRFGFVMTPRYPSLPEALRDGVAPRSLPKRALLALTHSRYVLLGRALQGADRICPTSQYAADLMQRAFALDDSRIQVVPNGVSDEFLVPAQAADAPDAPPSLRRPFALFFGRVTHEKGVYTILEALEKVGDLGLDFVFAGRGPALAELTSLVGERGLAERVHFLSWLDAKQLSSLVRRARVCVLPSFEESFGNTMVEAMALGVPVISTTAGSIPELIEHERTGILVTPGAAGELATAMQRLARDPERRAELGRAGRERVAEHFTWDVAAARFEHVYEQALGA